MIHMLFIFITIAKTLIECSFISILVALLHYNLRINQAMMLIEQKETDCLLNQPMIRLSGQHGF